MLRIVIAGLGSIGRRHVAALHNFPDLELAGLRSKKGTITEPLSNLSEIYSIEDALKLNPDGVIISNPTSKHIETAVPFLKQGIPVLIEKPIADSFKDLHLLEPYANLIRVAYCVRFHPVAQFVKQILLKEKPIKISFKRSFYLPFWHPYADYTKEYVSRKELGGGVIRTLSHEIDLMFHWLGEPIQIIGVVDKISELKINTDDFAFFTCKMNTGTRVNFELDLLSPANVNTGELITDQGKYEWNFNQVSFQSYDTSAEIITTGFGENVLDEMYTAQAADFLGFIQSGKSRSASLDEAGKIVRLISTLESNE